ncbi:MAG TPA: RNA polymerase subunit sigma-24 [Planctomycetaceae bacterium]|nr:RNA polymerase subunit sigma-24 [Planctomycetaceae bacterium]
MLARTADEAAEEVKSPQSSKDSTENRPTCGNEIDDSPEEVVCGEHELSAQRRLELTESLLDEYQDLVYGYAYRLVGNASVAEDLVQEVYLRAFKSIHNLRQPAAARSWLLTITRNEFSRWCKQKKPATSLETTEEAQELSEDVVVGSDLEHKEWVSVALGKLSIEYRLVIAMYYFEELSYSEIAAQLEIPIGTVMSRLNRAKKHLRDALLQAPDRTHNET